MKLWDFERYRQRIAVITDSGEKYRYKDIYELQKTLSQRIDRKSLVYIVTTNDIGSVIGYLACLINHCVPILVSANTKKESVYTMLESYMPEYIWNSKDDNKSSAYAAMGYKSVFSFLSYELWERVEKCVQKLHPELALLLPTSGSSGNPKLVRLSRNNIEENTKSICEYLKLTENERAVTSLPMSYTYGLSVINTFLHVGASIYLTDKSVCQKQFWNNVKKQGVTFFAGVPYTYEMMKKIHVGESALETLRKLTQAGGKLANEQQLFWGEFAQRTGKEFYIMYGQTEATARISYLPPKDCLRKIGSVGIAIPGCKVRIMASENGNECLIYESGEIVCIGRNVSMGYARERRDLQLGDENKGILYTGDMGYMDEKGYLYISGRKSRFAKIYGKRIDLAYLERQMEKEMGTQVVILSDDEKIYLYLEDVELGKMGVKYVQKKIGLYANVFEIRPMEELPRNEYGKVQYIKFCNESEEIEYEKCSHNKK